MDRNGTEWTGDDVAAEAAGETGGAAAAADPQNHARREDARAPRVRPSATSGVLMNDDGEVVAVTAGSGVAGESD